MFFTNRLGLLFKRLSLLLLPYSLLRLGFYFYHLDIYKQFQVEEIFKSFLLGIRFDVAAILLLNLSIILLALFPSENTKFLKFERLIFTIINTLGIIMALNDFELFLFMGKRLSSDIFAVTGDIIDQLPQIALYYWYFPLLAIAFGAGVYFFDQWFFSIREEKKGLWGKVASGIVLIALTVVGIRGGLQSKSINVQSAFVQGKNELGHLVLNSPYHFLRTLKNKRIEKLSYLKSDAEAKNILLRERVFEQGFESSKKFNVILLILESFSLEYVEQGYTPFLKSLIKDSIYFDKHLANGRRSIEVLPSILCGIPSLINDPVSKSSYSGNKFVCMPKLLKGAGYTNYFFHGGTRGTMGFESYTLSNGFDKYFAKQDYHGGDYDGTWGIYDGPYLQYVANHINKMPEPFLAGIFTLSSHQPYSVPAQYKGRFNKGTLEIHESIGYTDFAVKRFFDTVKNQAWFKNTIFIITADHTQKHESSKFQNLVGQYRVPLLIYSPAIKKREIDKVTQHSDIPPTVLDLVGVKGEMAMIGSSVFSRDQGMAINYANGSTYFLVQDNIVSTIDKAGNGKTLQIDWNSGSLTSVGPRDDKLLRASLQYFINGLLNNNLSP
jgi:phosphoglycerol transferase MdoB-like AlkP superfamily enzyme